MPANTFSGLGQPNIGSQPQPVGARCDFCGQGGELIEVGPIRQLPTIPLEIVGRDVAEGHPPVEPFAKGRSLIHGRPELRIELIGALNGCQHRAGRLGDHAGLDVARADRSGILVEAADDETARLRQAKLPGRPRIERSEVRPRPNNPGQPRLVKLELGQHLGPKAATMDVQQPGQSGGAGLGDVLAGKNPASNSR